MVLEAPVSQITLTSNGPGFRVETKAQQGQKEFHMKRAFTSKLVRISEGQVFQVVVDIRKLSPVTGDLDKGPPHI